VKKKQFGTEDRH